MSFTGAKFTDMFSFGDSPSIDAFGRARVSNPETIFDSKNIFNDPDIASNLENQPLYYDNQETSGSGTSTEYVANESAQKLSVSALTAGTRTRQTRQRFNYQPGKSLLIFMSFVMNAQQAGITQREGYFDDNNGLFLEDNGDVYRIIMRSHATGATVDTAIAQANWNLDKMDGTGNSGIKLDFTKTQILAIDLEWLGVGRVRMGFVIDGLIYYAHEFLNANNLSVVYMQTPNLPLRSEISNDGTGREATLVQICSTVVSEGGQNALGNVRFASTAGTHIDLTTENTVYALMGIRLKTAYIGEVVDILETGIQIQTASHKCEFFLLFNPTITGTFNYVDVPNSAVQIAKSAGAGATAVGAIQIGGGGFIESGGAQQGNAGSASKEIANALKLGSSIDNSLDEIVLCARPIGGSSNVAIECYLTWRELV